MNDFDEISEKTFEEKVKKHLKEQNIWCLKTWGNAIQRAGVPDLITCINGYFVGIELKSAHGRASKLQLWNIKKIRDCGGFAFVLYPSGYEKFKKFVDDLQNETFTKDMDIIIR